MKLQTLVYFTKIAEEGSYTSAAKKCFVSQPALSKAISELEEELNCILLERQGKKMQLTEAGKIAYKESKIILQHADGMKALIAETARQPMNVKVGYIIFGFMVYFQRRVSDLKNIRLIPAYDSTPIIRQRLLDGEIDLALLPLPCQEGLEQVHIHYLIRRGFYVLVHRTHPFYAYDSLRIADLAGVEMIGWAEDDFPRLAKAYDEQFLRKGIQPNFIARGRKMGDMITLMAQYNAVGIGGPAADSFSKDEYKMIPVIDSEERFGLCAVWRKENMNPALQELVKHL